MTINTADIKLMKSEVLLDTPDGGGGMTGQEVIDGQSNNLFHDVSALDRTYGRIALRKAFASIQTDNTDSYFGSHAIVSRKPQDPRVSVSLFSTKDWFDRRTSAKDQIERYLALGPLWPGHLLEKQLAGQRAIQLAMRPQDDEPKVGQGLGLVQNEGKANEFSQFVRVTKVTSQDRTFVDYQNRDILRKVVTVEISDPLLYTFEGPSVYQAVQGISGLAICRDTRVANASKYYGIAKCTSQVRINSMSAFVDDIFTQLVPSAQSETPLMDLNASGLSALFVPGNDSTITTTISGSIGPGARLYIGNAVYPGTLQLIANTAIIDDGGVLKAGTVEVGTIDYGSGLLTFNNNQTAHSGAKTLTFKPGATPTRVQDTACISIIQYTRGYNYTITLDPIPAPGSLVVSYVSQGKVYYLYERGNGQLKGSDAAFGSGSINFTTGTVLITTGALPDANTDIIFAWGKRSSTFSRGGSAVAPCYFEFKTANEQVVPSTVTITWMLNGTAKSATDNGNGGFTGDATGKINYARGEISLVPNLLTQQGTEFSVQYQFGPANELRFNMPLRNPDGTVSLVLPIEAGGAIVPKSVELVWNVDIIVPTSYSEISTSVVPIPRVDPLVQAFDNGSGGIKLANGNSQPGTIDYANRQITFLPESMVKVPVPTMKTVNLGVETTRVNNPDNTTQTVTTKTNYRRTASGWFMEETLATMPYDEKGYAIVRWRTAAGGSAVTETFTPTQVSFDLTQGYAETIIAGSMRFRLGGLTYVDRLGSLYHSIDASTGSGIVAGSIAYDTGKVYLTDWAPGQANSLELRSLATEMNVDPVDEVTFRIPVIPIRSGSLQVRAVPTTSPYTASAVTAFADANGRFDTEFMFGTVDYSTGVVRIKFGQRIPVTNEVKAEPWYQEAATFMMGGVQMVVKPRFMYSDTILYNAVGYTYMPLAADILGLDPVRLPSDGRVPVFNVGDVAVVHHTASAYFQASPPPQVGAVLNVGRERLSYMKLYDADNVPVAPNMYKTDLDAGTLTLTSEYIQGSYVMPLRVEHRIEDMSLISDVQINGQLAFNKPMTHDFPDNETMISSALIFGDLQSRAHTRFSQESWTNVWADAPIGNPILAQYNTTLYPIQVSNRGAYEEKWALIFTNATTFRVVGRGVGQITTGDINTICAPINPATGVPYFTLLPQGWGQGWVAGNVLRFNTAGAVYPIWLARTVLQGPVTLQDDSFQVQIRGDIDR